MSHAAALVDEVANELETWPGVRIERASEHSLLISYDGVELGVLDRESGTAELRFTAPERDQVVEHGGALPAEPVLAGENVSHDVQGPSDVTAVLARFDRRYRDVRGEDDPYSSSD